MNVNNIFREVKWAAQRVVRGYDDRIFWCMSEYLDPIILAGVQNIREHNHGYPNGLTQKRWNKVLDKRIVGFGEEPDDIKSMKKYYKDKEQALILFAYYYNDLWD